MTNPMLFRFNGSDEFYTDERCSIIEMSNSHNDEECSIAQARVAPGVQTANHHLEGIIERYVILEGEGEVFIGNEPGRVMSKGDTLIIPANMPQSIRNNSEHNDLIFLCICTPRFLPEKYVNLESDIQGQKVLPAEDSTSAD